MFGEPTHFEYWIINDNKTEENLNKPMEYREDGTLILQPIGKGTFVIGKTTHRLNFHEVTADKLDVICSGVTDDFHVGHHHEWREVWVNPEMEN